VESIQKDPAVIEIIVVDGGSVDQTLSIVRNLKVKTFSHLAQPEKGGGRGGQIHAGLIHAKGDIVAVVHADIIVTGNEFSAMLEVLQKNPLVIGGAVGSLFNSSGFRMRLIEYANDMRAAFSGISFGDQIQFFRRIPVQDQEIYPAIPLMEDVELALRLKRLGNLVYLFGQAKASSRRWKKYGSTNLVSIVIRFGFYLCLRLNKNFNTYTMYCDYYHHSKKKDNKYKPISL
jgi:glycosyltransferase involved in cell wall biosynthesis